MQDNPLWQYSLTVYSRPQVEPLLLALQNRHHADVNLLLCCGWMGSRGQLVSPEGLQALMDLSAPWREQCVQPLRGVRRFLKGLPGHEALREQVKALEIEAEQRQQALIYQQWQQLDLAATDATSAISDNLDLYGSLLETADRQGLSQSLDHLARLIVEQA